MTPREQAKQDGLKHYFTGLPCRNGHVEKRKTLDGTCLACARENTKKWVILNREKYLERKAIAKAKTRQKDREATALWKQLNPEKRNASEGKRRAARLQRTPAWADGEQIAMWYSVAEVLSRGGVSFHVDHIIPMQAKEVSGLHVENNLQVLPWHQNLKKGNSYERRTA